MISRAIRRYAKRFGVTVEQAELLMLRAHAYVIEAGSNPFAAFKLAAERERGAVSIQSIIMIFIAIVIIYQLIPNISNDNQVVQASANASAMAKFSAGLGEWMFPLLGIVAVVFLLFKGKKKGGDMG